MTAALALSREGRGLDAGGAGSYAATGVSRPLIVEVFGPAGAGKTTFAAALHRELQSSGCRSELVSSARPAERGARQTVLAPLSRAAKLFGAMAERGADDPIGAELLSLFPPRGSVEQLRQRRYLARLHRACSMARPPGTALILDQGYLTALCSLAAFYGLAKASDAVPLLARALDLMPAANLVVWVQTPETVLCERLNRRLAGQSRLERLFEPDIVTLMDQAHLAGLVCRLLRTGPRAVVEVRGSAPPGDETEVRTVVAALAALTAERAS